MKLSTIPKEGGKKIYNFILKALMSPFFRRFVFCCILASISSVVLESFHAFKKYSIFLFGITYFSSFIFLGEYLLRLISAPSMYVSHSALRARFKYIFSFYGLIDFIAFLPFVLVYYFWDTDIIHVITLPYVLTIFKLIRYSKSFRLIGEVLSSVKEELVTAYTACGILVCFSAILMYYIEHNAQPEAFKNIGDGLWWAIVSFTTVGYGDLYPITPLGKLLSCVISLIAIGMIALPTAIISSSFMNMMQQKQQNLKDSKSEDEKI
ncbi:MAG: ion transporter [Phocaeicola sp.]